MPARRSPLLIVLAIGNFLFAVVFIGCGVCANISETASWHAEINNVRLDADTLRAHLNNVLPGYSVIKISGIVIGYLICIGLILSGVALLLGRVWGMILALLVYAGAFVHHAFLLVYQLVWVGPAMTQFFNQLPPGIFQALGVVPRIPAYTSIAWWAVGCLYYLVAGPLVLLVLLRSVSAGDDDAEPTRKSRRRRDEGEDDEPRPRRRSS